MAQGKKIPKNPEAASVEAALLAGDWPLVRYAMAVKLARMFDHTESARDVKALSVSLAPLIRSCEAAHITSEGTELAQILAEAEQLLQGD